MGAKQPHWDRQEDPSPGHVDIIVNRDRLVQMLRECLEERDLGSIRHRVSVLRDTLLSRRPNHEYLLNVDPDGDTISFRGDVLQSELGQILESRTVERAHYYIDRLRMGCEQVRTSRINDINLLRWKEYDEIETDSLWVFRRRDTSGAHIGSYWGNFIPQIPHQIMLRYTKRGEWVLDPFVGSGTTLIECRQLGRNGIGVELNPDVAHQAAALVESEPNKLRVVTDLVAGDSTALDFQALVRERGIESVQLLLMHPPYHDIIRFSADPRDLSNAPSVEAFLEMFGQVVERTDPILDDGRYLAVVIGDKCVRGEWVPLGFYVMQEVLDRGYTLKSIVVKNFEETRAKRQQQGLWRYRALAGGFYVFKHEYVFLFRKAGKAE